MSADWDTLPPAPYDPTFQDPWAEKDAEGSPAVPTESCDLDAERAVIGAMISYPAVVPLVAEQVASEEFYDPKLGQLAQILFDLDRDRTPFDALTVIRELRARGLEKKIPADRVFSLVGAVAVPAAAPTHAHAIRQHAKLRHVGLIARQLLGLSRSTHLDDVTEALVRAQQQLDELHNANPALMPPMVGERLEPALDRFEKRAETSPKMACFGLRALDERFHGFKAGQLTLIAGRPGNGKSLLGLCVARATSMTMQNPVLLASLEMTCDEVMDRLVCAEARVDLTRAEDNALDENDWARIAAVTDRIAKANLRIDDRFEVTLDYLRNLVRTLRRGPGCGLLIVDYLQLITPPRMQSREQAIAAVSRGLKGLGKEFGIPVVALCQINRESEKRADKVPILSDLRESGSLEQDADNVILLDRPELRGEENRVGEIDLIVAKHRGGHPFIAKAAFQGHYGRMADLARNNDWTPHAAMADAR